MRNMNTTATVNTTVEAVATTSYLPESINGLAREVQRIAVDLRKVTNPWSPKAADLTEADIRKVLLDYELSFRSLMTNLVAKAGYKIEDSFDEMFLDIFINTVSGIDADLSAARELALQKFLDENPNWEEEADKPVEDDDDWEDDDEEVIVLAVK